jgi:hypothetical protein
MSRSYGDFRLISLNIPERFPSGASPEGAYETEGGGMAPDTEGLVPDIPVKLRKNRPRKGGKQRLGSEMDPLDIEHTLDTPDLLQRQPADPLPEPPGRIGQPQQLPDLRLGEDRG